MINENIEQKTGMSFLLLELRNEKVVIDTNISFYDFCKNYIRINDSYNSRTFNYYELKQIEEIQNKLDSGYEFRLLKSRGSSKIIAGLYQQKSTK